MDLANVRLEFATCRTYAVIRRNTLECKHAMVSVNRLDGCHDRGIAKIDTRTFEIAGNDLRQRMQRGNLLAAANLNSPRIGRIML